MHALIVELYIWLRAYSSIVKVWQLSDLPLGLSISLSKPVLPLFFWPREALWSLRSATCWIIAAKLSPIWVTEYVFVVSGSEKQGSKLRHFMLQVLLQSHVIILFVCILCSILCTITKLAVWRYSISCFRPTIKLINLHLQEDDLALHQSLLTREAKR